MVDREVDERRRRTMQTFATPPLGPTEATETQTSPPPSPPAAGARLRAQWLPPWSLLTFVRQPDRFFLEGQHRRGDTYLLRTGVGPMYVSADPEVAKAVFTAGPERVDHPGADLLGALIGERSVLVANGDTHKRLRQLLVPAFTGERMRALEGRMQAAALARLQMWAPGKVVDVGPEMEHIALDVILSVVLGMEGERHEAMRANVKETLSLVNADLMFLKSLRVELGGLTRFGRLQNNRRASRALLDDEMVERRAAGVDRGTILDSLLAARDDEGLPMSDDEIYDQVITLLVAGHETTATGLMWTFHHLLGDRRLTAVAAEEVANARDARGLASSTLLDNICRESLRLTPVIPEVPRLITADFEAGGVHFEAGHRLLIAIPALHRRPDIFASPDDFWPERFETRRYMPWEYAPFGGGVRKCLGWAFALTQMKIILGSALSRFELELVDQGAPVAARRNLSVGPQGGVKLRVLGRRAS
jgi:cytochrome P450